MRTLSLYLVRHGLAAERGAEWPDDGKRPLVPRGVARLRKEAAALKTLDVTFDVILTSPLTRAKQTADVLAAGLSPHPPVHAIQSLVARAAPTRRFLPTWRSTPGAHTSPAWATSPTWDSSRRG